MNINKYNIDKTDMEKRIFTPKQIVTTTMPIGVKEWLDHRRVPVNKLLDIGFRHLMDMRERNKRLSDLELRVVQMEKSITKYDKRVRDMYQKFCEIKKKHSLPEGLEI